MVDAPTAAVAVMMVGLLLVRTATSLSNDRCRLWSGLAHHSAPVEMFGLKSIAALTPARSVRTAFPHR